MVLEILLCEIKCKTEKNCKTHIEWTVKAGVNARSKGASETYLIWIK